jgi:hypothetical protein
MLKDQFCCSFRVSERFFRTRHSAYELGKDFCDQVDRAGGRQVYVLMGRMHCVVWLTDMHRTDALMRSAPRHKLMATMKIEVFEWPIILAKQTVIINARSQSV